VENAVAKVKAQFAEVPITTRKLAEVA